jgi:Protein of unknown function (DUF2793)
MPHSATARHALPNLFVGQAQKEITHNEALARIDALLHPVIQATLAAPPTLLGDESDGFCWLIASAATGAWAGKSKQIARWSGGSWRYLMPVNAMTIWHVADQVMYFYNNDDWISGGAIDDPVLGNSIDMEARSTINAILAHLRAIGSIRG